MKHTFSYNQIYTFKCDFQQLTHYCNFESVTDIFGIVRYNDAGTADADTAAVFALCKLGLKTEIYWH